MIEAGITFCPCCGGAFSEGFYANYNGTDTYTIAYSRGLGGKHFSIIRNKDTAQQEVIEIPPEVRNKIVDGDGLPNDLRIKDPATDRSIELHRFCPYCWSEKRKTLIDNDSCRYPTYVIAVLGGRKEGKTSWLNALRIPENLNAMNQASKYISISFPRLRAGDTRDHADETAVESIGSTVLASVNWKRGTNTVKVCNLLLRDVAGEVMEKAEQGHLAWNILAPNDDHKYRYSGPDAYLVFHDCAKPEEEITKAYNAICDHFEKAMPKVSWPVTGFVFTHLDDAMKNGTLRANNCELICGTTFPEFDFSDQVQQSSYYGRENYLRRIGVEDGIAQLTSALYRTHKQNHLDQTSHSHGFLIKSCENDDQGCRVYDHPINVLDPLIWVLLELKLFSLDE